MLFEWSRRIFLVLYELLAFSANKNVHGDAVVVEPYLLQADTLRWVQLSMELSHSVFRPDDISRDDQEQRLRDTNSTNTTRTIKSMTKIFETVLDRAMVRYEDDTCYVAFRGTNANPLDSLQSFPSFAPEDVCGAAGCCGINKGVAMAYYTEYVEKLELEVASCRAQ